MPPMEGMPPPLPFFATAAKGTEGALRDELREMGLPDVRADRGGVHFGGDWTDGWRACLHSRVALRVLAQVSRFPAPDERALYGGVRSVDWRPFLTPDRTLAVSAVCRDSHLTHTGFLAQKTKDAVVDQMRGRLGARPDVDRKDPDVSLFLHLRQDVATLYLDLAGESLHRRGWRTDGGEAPLKETLAAAILRLSGWDRQSPLQDPLCGSGTIPIEADLWARNVAPGLFRPRFGFERWACHGESARALMAVLRDQARQAIRPTGPMVQGTDRDPAAIERARTHARQAESRATFQVAELADLRPLSPPGFVVANPPYGARLQGDASLQEDLDRLGDRLPGHTIVLLLGSQDLRLRRRPDRWLALFNGDIACRLVIYRPGAP